MRALPLIIGGALLLTGLLLTGCAGDDPTGTPTPAQTYAETPRPVRLDEVAVHAPPRNSGDIEFRVLGRTADQPRIAGSHAEVESKNGQYVRVRVLATNSGRTSAELELAAQRLVTADGRTFEPDGETMGLKRQPLTPSLGAAVRLEFDLWYDIPAGLKPVSVRLVGTTTYTVKDPPAAEIALG